MSEFSEGSLVFTGVTPTQVTNLTATLAPAGGLIKCRVKGFDGDLADFSNTYRVTLSRGTGDWTADAATAIATVQDDLDGVA